MPCGRHAVTDPTTIITAIASAVSGGGGGAAIAYWKMRGEKDDRKATLKIETQKLEDAKESIAVEAAESAVQVMRAAMDSVSAQQVTMQKQITDLNMRVTSQDAKITDIEAKHKAATAHIGEREVWTIEYFGSERPATLPKIPDVIADDVLASAPDLRVHLHPASAEAVADRVIDKITDTTDTTDE